MRLGKRPDSPASRRVAVAGIEPHRVYRAALTDLEPGSVFHYRVFKGDRGCLLGRSPRDQVGRSAVSVRGLRRLRGGHHRAEATGLAGVPVSKPDFVMIPGDIVYEYGLISEYREKFWPVYNADEPSESGVPLLRSTPFVAAPGNHDIDTRDLDRHPDALAYYLLLGPAAQRPARAEGGPFVPLLKASECESAGRSPRPPARRIRG